MAMGHQACMQESYGEVEGGGGDAEIKDVAVDVSERIFEENGPKKRLVVSCPEYNMHVEDHA